MDRQGYGENFQNHLLEQYKIYVEMADRVSARRSQVNSFFISLISGLLALLSIFTNKEILSQFQSSKFQSLVFIIISLTGLVLCFTWHSIIRSYKQLNSAKFKVLMEIEKQLPFPAYEREWELLRKDKDYKGYLEQTFVEKYIPFILAVPYFGLIIYSIALIIN
jgi:hypothetical protein